MSSLKTNENTMFSPLMVSTMTCAGSLIEQSNVVGEAVNILAIAKWVELDDVLVGVKIVYAGGRSRIVRGTCRPSKKAKDFLCQVTFNVLLGQSYLSYKLFHNGSLQLTGAQSVDEAVIGLNRLLDNCRNAGGLRSIALKKVDNGVLISHDHLIYSSLGRVIGYDTGETLFIHALKNHAVVEEFLGFKVIQSQKWKKMRKEVYTLDGEHIATLKLKFKAGVTDPVMRKNFTIVDNEVMYGHQTIGVQQILLHEDQEPIILKLRNCVDMREKFIYGNNKVLSNVKLFPLEPTFTGKRKINKEDIGIHNLNVRFQANFRVYRDQLWQCLVNEGYVARFDSTSHVGVNVRYHYLPNQDQESLKMEDRGKCRCPNQIAMLCDKCKIVSLLCFVSGKVVITGLSTLEESKIVADFVKWFYEKHYDMIAEK